MVPCGGRGETQQFAIEGVGFQNPLVREPRFFLVVLARSTLLRRGDFARSDHRGFSRLTARSVVAPLDPLLDLPGVRLLSFGPLFVRRCVIGPSGRSVIRSPTARWRFSDHRGLAEVLRPAPGAELNPPLELLLRLQEVGGPDPLAQAFGGSSVVVRRKGFVGYLWPSVVIGGHWWLRLGSAMARAWTSPCPDFSNHCSIVASGK